MLRMARNDSSKNDSLDLDLPEEVVDEPAQTSVPAPAPEVKPEPAGKAKVAFDSDYKLDDPVDVIVVCAGGSPLYELKTDGSPLEVPAEDAKLLVENSPAVKEAN